MAHGGRRPGSGNKKGAKLKPTRDKAAAREALRELVTRHMEEMTEAQIANSKGIKYLVSRNKKTGKFTRVTEHAFDATDPDTIEVWEKDPSAMAYADLMDRALDKAGNSVQEVKITGEAEMIQHLYAGRQHARAKRRSRG